jgi:hypothetical protein
MFGPLEKADPSQLHVYEWGGWNKFLITHAVPAAKRVEVTPGSLLCSFGLQTMPAMLHVNLSRPETIFPDYKQWLAVHEETGRPVLNGYCVSLDKWATQEACAAAGLRHVRASAEGDPDEVLILKSRANHCGMHEGLLPADLAGDMAPPPWPYPERIHRLKRKEIAAEIWDNRQLTVERYISNRQGRFHRAYVVGEYVAVATSTSPQLVKEMSHDGGVELISTMAAASRPLDHKDPIAAAYQLARAMRVDFAALDLAIDEDEMVYPIDLNTTPHWGKSATLNPRLIKEMRDAFEPLIVKGSQYSTGARRTLQAT